MLISLTEAECNELTVQYSGYSIDPAPTPQPNWQSKKFASTNRVARCVVNADGSVTIKQIIESVTQTGGTPLWL